MCILWVNFACKSQAAYHMCAWYLKRPEVGVGSSGKLVLLMAKSLLGAGYGTQIFCKSKCSQPPAASLKPQYAYHQYFFL